MNSSSTICPVDGERPTDGAHWRENAPNQERESLLRHHSDNLRKQNRAAVKQAAQTEPQEQRTMSAKTRTHEADRGSITTFMILGQLSFAIVHDASRQVSVGGHFFTLISFFSGEAEFTKFVSEKIDTARARHIAWRRRILMPASPRRRRAVTATKHESGLSLSPFYRGVSCGSALEVWAILMRSLSKPACTQQTVCRGAAPAIRLDPLASRSDKRGRSRALIFSVLNGASVIDPKLVNFTSGTTARANCNCTIARLASCTWGARLLQTSVPRRAWSRRFILWCDPSRSHKATSQACLHLVTLLSRSQVSFCRTHER